MIPLSYEAILRSIELNGAAVERNKKAFDFGRWAILHPDQATSMITSDVVSLPKRIEDKIAERMDHLRLYQNDSLAQKYKAMVDKIADPDVKAAVAEGYHKLLSYKDEYEVARLHLDTMTKAKDAFDNISDIKLHLAPPLMSKTGPDGRPLKREFGAWMLKAFGILAKFKGLRGTVLDPFGYTSERKMERALIQQYEQDLEAVLPQLNNDTKDAIVSLARLPLDIRGFGPVKLANAQAAEVRRAALLSAIQAGNSASKTAAE